MSGHAIFVLGDSVGFHKCRTEREILTEASLLDIAEIRLAPAIPKCPPIVFYEESVEYKED